MGQAGEKRSLKYGQFIFPGATTFRPNRAWLYVYGGRRRFVTRSNEGSWQEIVKVGDTHTQTHPYKKKQIYHSVQIMTNDLSQICNLSNRAANRSFGRHRFDDIEAFGGWILSRYNHKPIAVKRFNSLPACIKVCQLRGGGPKVWCFYYGWNAFACFERWR